MGLLRQYVRSKIKKIGNKIKQEINTNNAMRM